MTEREAAEEAGAGHGGLAATFHEKVISLHTMDLRLLLPTAVSLALVIASAVLLATQNLPWPLVSAGEVSGTTLTTVPLPVATLAAAALVIAWSFILTGALHAHLVGRVVGVGLYAGMGLLSAYLASSALAALGIFLIVLSVVVAAAGLYLTDRGNHHQAPHLHHRARLRPYTFGWVLLTTALIFALLAVGERSGGTFVILIAFQLTSLEFLLIPVLVLAGTDFAEWAEVVSGRVGWVLERLGRPALLGALAVAGAGALVWAVLTQGVTLGFAVRAMVPVVLFGLLVGALGLLSLRRPASTRVPFWALAAAAVLLVATLAGAAYVHVVAQDRQTPTVPGVPPLVAVTHHGDPAFRLLVPQGWSETAVPGGWMFSGPVDGRPSRLVLAFGPRDADRALTGALGTPVQLRAGPPEGGWQSSSVTTAIAADPAAGEVWTRGSGDRTWVLAGLRSGGGTATSAALFEAVRASWTPSPAKANAENELTSLRLDLETTAGGSAVGSLLLIVLGLALLLRGRGEVATGGLFLTLCGMFLGSGYGLVGALFTLVGADANTHAVTPVSTLLTLGVGALVLVAVTSAVPRWRLPEPVLRLLLVLFLGLIGLQILAYGVFSAAESAGERFTIVGGVVLVAAMLWDVLMSGESFTNTGGRAVPRHTRVLIYLGYTMLVVTAVLFFGAQQVQGGGSAGNQFESDSWPQAGITSLGPPLLLTFFFVNLAAWRKHRPMGRADGLDQVDRSVLDEALG